MNCACNTIFQLTKTNKLLPYLPPNVPESSSLNSYVYFFRVMDDDIMELLVQNDEGTWISLKSSKTLLTKRSDYFRKYQKVKIKDLSLNIGNLGAMFESEFAESHQKSVKVQEVSLTIMTKILDFLLDASSINIGEDNVFDLLQAAGMLQIPTLQRRCIDYLVQNLSVRTVITILSYSERLLSEELYSKALQFILCETEGDDRKIENLIKDWVETDPEHHEPMKETLLKCILESKVPISNYPCCVGRYKKTPYLFLYNTDKSILEPFLSLAGKATAHGVTANGFKVFSNKSKLYLFGGEFGLYGRGLWNYDVWRYDTITKRWDQILTLNEPIRHCSIGKLL